MGSFKTPQQKKEESYKHDRVEGGEYPHADRKNRPLAKARVRRQFRRTAKQLLAAEPEEAHKIRDSFGPGWFSSAVKLPTHLERTAHSRLEREAHNIFRRGYNPATHARFAKVVTSWIDGRSEHSSVLARFYAGVLDLTPFDPQDLQPDERSLAVRRGFLASFFRTEPELKQKFDKWIRSTEPSQS